MSVELVEAASAREVVGQQVRVEGAVVGGIVGDVACVSALGRAGEAGQRVAAFVHAGRVEGRVDEADRIVFAEEGVLVDGPHLDIVDPLDVGEVAADADVGERAGLDDGFGLDGTEVGEGVAARVVVVGVAADEATEVEDRVRADSSGVGGRDVVGDDLGTLIRVADVAEGGAAASAAGEDILDVEVVVGVGGLEPGAAEAKVEVDRVGSRELAVDAVEDIQFVPFSVEDGELRRVEEPASVQAVDFDEVAPVFAAVAEVDGAG